MTTFFKNKKKEVLTGSIKGIQHLVLDGHYKKFDDSIAPDDATANKEDNFTVVNDGHFVTLSIGHNDSYSPVSESVHHGLTNTPAPSAPSLSSQEHLNREQTKMMSGNTSLTSKPPSPTVSNEVKLHCNTILTNDERQKMSKSVSTRKENDDEREQENCLRSDGGNVEHKEVQTDETTE
jgi:hypothetical protein